MVQETSTPQVVFLAARGDLVSNGFNLWKQRSDLSYRDVGAFAFEFSGGSGPLTITNAQLVAALGAEIDFNLRAWFVRSGLRSLNYDELTVRKV